MYKTVQNFLLLLESVIKKYEKERELAKKIDHLTTKVCMTTVITLQADEKLHIAFKII